jgi:hypothetical protein
MQTGDFWGPIFHNLRTGGGWLKPSEIFGTGFEHRFVPKSPLETESWARFVEVEKEEDNEPAMMLFREISRVYRDGQPAIDLPRDHRNAKRLTMLRKRSLFTLITELSISWLWKKNRKNCNP